MVSTSQCQKIIMDVQGATQIMTEFSQWKYTHPPPMKDVNGEIYRFARKDPWRDAEVDDNSDDTVKMIHFPELRGLKKFGGNMDACLFENGLFCVKHFTDDDQFDVKVFPSSVIDFNIQRKGIMVYTSEFELYFWDYSIDVTKKIGWNHFEHEKTLIENHVSEWFVYGGENVVSFFDTPSEYYSVKPSGLTLLNLRGPVFQTAFSRKGNPLLTGDGIVACGREITKGSPVEPVIYHPRTISDDETIVSILNSQPAGSYEDRSFIMVLTDKDRLYSSSPYDDDLSFEPIEPEKRFVSLFHETESVIDENGKTFFVLDRDLLVPIDQDITLYPLSHSFKNPPKSARS